MRRRGLIATTHTDRQNERIPKEALEALVETINTRITPLTVKHDPRLPPVGRQLSAELVELEDGEYGVRAEVEVFEPGQEPAADIGDRDYQPPNFEEEGPKVIFDHSYYSEDSHPERVEEFESLGVETGVYAKKAAVPLSELIVTAGKFVAGSVAAGFLGAIGADAYDQLKGRVKEAVQERREDSEEYLHTFQWVTKLEGELVQVRIVLPNPTDADIDWFYEEGLEEVDQMIADSDFGPADVREVVLEIENREVASSYAVDADGIPLELGTRA